MATRQFPTLKTLVRFLAPVLLAGCTAFASPFDGCGDGTTACEPTCELDGEYEMTVEGCGSSLTYTAEHSWSVDCIDGDVCDKAVPATFCSFVANAGDGCLITTTARLVE